MQELKSKCFIKNIMQIKIHTLLSSVDDLRKKRSKKIPRFAFEYLDVGCMKCEPA